MKNLTLLNDNTNIKLNDTGTVIQFKASNENQPIGLSNGQSATFRIKNELGFLKSVNASTSYGGYVFELDTEDLKGLVPDTYQVELLIQVDSDNALIFPDKGFVQFTINANALNITGEQLPVMSLDDFKDELKTYVDNQTAQATTNIKNDFDTYVDNLTDSTVATATKASQDAQTAINTANTAKSTADSAITKANSAQSTADTATNKANNAQSTADNVTSLVNAQMVSPNLVPYSGMFQSLSGWTSKDYGGSSGNLSLLEHSYFKNGTEKMIWINNPSPKGKAMSAISTRIPLEPNTDYVFQISGFQTGNANNHVYVLGTTSTSPSNNDTFENKLVSQVEPFNAGGLTVVKNVRFNSGNNVSCFIRVDNEGSSTDASCTVMFANVKIEKGTQSTEWVPSIYSLKNRVDTLETKVASTLQSQAIMLTQMANIQSSINNEGSGS